MSETRKIVSPEPNAETASFWSAAAEGKLLIKRCDDCGEPFYYPRAICPFCGGDRTSWIQTKGAGAIYTFSIMRRVTTPYCIAYVTLDEGPTIMTNIVNCDLDAIRIGDRVTVTFVGSENGQMVPMFSPDRTKP